MAEKYEVIVDNGDVFVNGKFTNQCCYNSDTIGMALANAIEGKYDDSEDLPESYYRYEKPSLENRKFFDRPVPTNVLCNISYEIDQLRQCLESEGIVLTNDEVIRAIDMYLRIIGLDRDVDQEKGLQALYSWFGACKFNSLDLVNNNANTENIINGVKDAFNILNKLTKNDEDKIKDITQITNNVTTVFKEFSTFMDEILDSMYYICTNTENCIDVSYCANISDKPTTMLLIRMGIRPGIKEFVFEITSNAISSDIPDDVAISMITFSKESQETFTKK